MSLLSGLMGFLFRSKKMPPRPNPADVLDRAITDTQAWYSRLSDRLDDTSEDSYATRNELRDRMYYVQHFEDAMKQAKATSSMTVDLSIRYGVYDDPEDDAIARYEAASCGLEYVPDEQREEAEYASALWGITEVQQALEAAGFTVLTGFHAYLIDPEESQRAMEAFHAEILAEQEQAACA
ncbi:MULTISPECIES: hypothetical protein [Acetobacteraceae]|jgi:hypothetical protein|uniref:Uncharacterized protein n=3 Tax=Acetobacteraceae TaxID=433 RepID=A0A2S3VXN7_9PROT|nr:MULTISPECIES: hypothetical protein [Acetobacteraceae]POF61358.1 hypothetical protein KMAL_30120 [Novacetimonas maltaceti]PYD58015.1 hypothetical protein CFR73_15510 [Novacetimonas maltaceti]PYD70694.1 hypothetical protein CFR74_15335 [Novacetimonas hansenii]RFP04151.1 hypothetical protein BGC30_00395 [Novacetimonas hansenii]WEQ60511.1 hypothetical protein LV563_14950 [Novacetimonas hansenii]